MKNEQTEQQKVDSNILESLFVSRLYNDLMAVEQSYKVGLKKKPGDLNLLGGLRRVQHDINMLTPIVQGTGLTAVQHLEKKYGIEFKFIKNQPPEKDGNGQMKITK